MTASLERARTAFAARAWREACALFEASPQASRTVGDHEQHAVAAALCGDDAACERAWEAGHRAALEAGDAATAARHAFWLALSLLLRGQGARAAGWMARAARAAEDAGECAATGYLLVPHVLGALEAGDPATARDITMRVLELGRRFADNDLQALGTLGLGQALIALGDLAAGTAALDEVMVAVTADGVGPVTTGIVYCAALLECMALHDLPRATEWTAAFGGWCDAQPELVAYRGQCLVHRSQVEQAAGQWPAALSLAEAARHRLGDPPHPALGLAHYQEAELLRLRGALDDAEAAYRRASRHGHHPMPGLALLELARGDVDAAAAAVRRALGEGDRSPALQAAAVEVLLAAGDVAGARAAAEVLAGIAAASPSAALAAMADHATGAVLAAEDDLAGALAALRSAASGWQTLRVPYEAARTAMVIGRVCAALGDRAAAALELGTAVDALAELGAAPDLARARAELDGMDGVTTSPASSLSAREREVLGVLVTGASNREIAAALVISEHTVRRHVEHIFTKLGVTSRAAATAVAYERGLLA